MNAQKHPDTKICLAAKDLARDHSPPFLFNHVMRTFFFAKAAAARQNSEFDEEMLFLGCVLHDLGLVDEFIGADRFEVDGADAAADFLSRNGYSDKKIAVIWDAIALHTTLSIPQRKQPEIALVQLGAGIDIGAVPRSILDANAIEETLKAYPRLNFKKSMLAAMGSVIKTKPTTGAFNLMGDVARHHEQIAAPNFCDVVTNAEFDE